MFSASPLLDTWTDTVCPCVSQPHGLMNQAMRDSNTLFTIRSVKTFHVSGIPLICTVSLVTPYPLVLSHEFFFLLCIRDWNWGIFSFTFALFTDLSSHGIPVFNLGVVKSSAFY